jgi:hypothetical protein
MTQPFSQQAQRNSRFPDPTSQDIDGQSTEKTAVLSPLLLDHRMTVNDNKRAVWAGFGPFAVRLGGRLAAAAPEPAHKRPFL